MLDFCTFKWKPAPGYRSKFEGRHVNIWASMIRRNYRGPCRFTCITDDPSDIDREIRIVPLWPEHAKLVSAYGSRNPSCYRRLKLFSDEAHWFLGERIVHTDLDIVITADVTSFFDRPEEFVIYESPMLDRRYRYNGSVFMVTAGARRQLWEKFDPIKSPLETRKRGFFGSDQAWISMILGDKEAVWNTRDGIYSWRLHLDGTMRNGSLVKNSPPLPLPDNARIVVFHGADDPWDRGPQQIDWIRKHYR